MSTAAPSTGGDGARALVTGGSGFIGSHLVEHLLAGGARVCVIDDLSTGRRENLDAARTMGGERLRIVESGVLGGLATLRDGGARFDEVYHLAASVGVERVVDYPIETIEANVLLTAELLRFAQSNGPEGGAGARTLIASSSEVYGKSTRLPFNEEDDCVYGPTTALRWSYAATKAIDEYLALAYHGKHGLPSVVVRFFNTVGPRQVGDYGMVLPRFVRAAARGETLRVFGDGRQTRCFCDVRDSAPALVRLLREPTAVGRVFNLGSDRRVSILELAELVIEAVGSPSGVELVAYGEAYGDGFEDLRDRVPDLARVREAIGFVPGIALEQTIVDIAREMGFEPGATPAGGTGAAQ